MADMSKFSEKNLLHCPKCNKEFPSQGRGRYVQIVDTIRANQLETWRILHGVTSNTYPENWNLERAKQVLSEMHKQDRDALLWPGGILTLEQIEMLK